MAIDLSTLPVPVIGFGMLVVMGIGGALGQAFRVWHARRPQGKVHEAEESVAQEGYLLGGVMALLGLLLAFSFGMVLDRYETRRQIAIDEANAIGTAYLRSQFLDEPYRSQLSRVLVDYTANLITLGAAEDSPGPYLAKNDRLLTEMWAGVRAARESAAAHGTTTVLLNTFNDVIDFDAKRKIAWELRLPPEVLVLVLSYLAITAAVVGYQINGPRGRRAAVVLFALIALSMTFITDINRPMGARGQDLQKPMLMLLQSLRAQPPQVFDQAPNGGGEAGP
jgi:hypothetical protein